MHITIILVKKDTSCAFKEKAYAVFKKYIFRGVNGMKREGDVLEEIC